jgi:hypothetical protein
MRCVDLTGSALDDPDGLKKMLRAMVREKTKTTVIARKLKRTYNATRQKASALGVKLAGSQRKKRA